MVLRGLCIWSSSSQGTCLFLIPCWRRGGNYQMQCSSSVRNNLASPRSMQSKNKGFPISEWQNDRFSTDCFSAVMHAWWFIIARTAQSCDPDWCITMYSGLLGDNHWQYSTIKMIIASKAVSLFNPIWLSFSFSNPNRFFSYQIPMWLFDKGPKAAIAIFWQRYIMPC